MENLILKNLKKKDLIVKKIGMDYKKIKFLEGNSLMICEDEETYLKDKKDMNYYNDLKSKIDYILLQMEECLSNFIYHEYLSHRSENWWVYKYSRSSYYRIKHKAIDEFLGWWYA